MKLFYVGCILFLLFFDRCGVNENTVIDARILRSRIVNYKNPPFPNEPPWLQYVIILENKSEFPLVFHSEASYLIIESRNKKFKDSINVVLGRKILLPQELDTIYVTDLFLEKNEGFAETNWTNPDVMRFICLADSTEFSYNYILEESMKGHNGFIYLKSFAIKKARDFTFTIE